MIQETPTRSNTYSEDRILHHITVNRDGTWEDDNDTSYDPNYYKTIVEDMKTTQEELREEIGEMEEDIYLGDLDELLEDLSFYEGLIQIFEKRIQL